MPILCDSGPSLKDQVINLLGKLITAQSNSFHKSFMITYGPDVWKSVTSHPVFSVNVQTESLEDLGNEAGCVPEALPGLFHS